MLKLAKNLELPIDAITQKFAFLARTGAGKTYAATKLCELMLELGAQVVALDPVGVWYGLRLSADGKGKGFSIPVFGGEHGDLPLEPEAGALIARLVVEKQICAVLDVSTFRKEGRKRFVTDFAEELFHLKKINRSPIHIFLEECQKFVPQKTFKGEERMLGAFEDLVRLGRNYGIGASMISQRPQSVNKDVLNQTECLVAFQTSGIQERKTIKDWISAKGVDEDIDDILPKLEVGEAHVWSPQWLKVSLTTKVFKKQTYDASATPVFGEKIIKPNELSPVDLENIKSQMADVVQRADENDPVKLKKQIAELRRELATQPKEAAKEIIREIPVYPEKELKALRDTIADFRTDYIAALERIADGFERLNGNKFVERIEAVGLKLAGNTPPIKTPVQIAQPAPRTVIPVSSQLASLSGNDSLNKAERLILRAFYWTRNDHNVTSAKIGFYSGYSHKSGGFASTLSSLRGKGLLVGKTITPEGEEIAAQYAQVKPTGAELREWLRPKLNKCENEILDVLVANPGARFDNETLAQNTVSQYSHASGGFASALSKLRSLEAAEGYGREGVKAADVFFE